MRAFLSVVLAVSPPEPDLTESRTDSAPEVNDVEAEPVEAVDAEVDAEVAPTDAPAEPLGCTKDTDCKGDRICDAATRACQDPAPPAPQVQDDGPPTWYRSAAPTQTHHPYVAGGVTMIVLGTAGVIAGGAMLGVYKKKVDAAAKEATMTWDPAAGTDDFANLSERGPKVNAGAGILISSGAVLFVTGIILAAIKQPVRVAVAPGGLTLRF